MAGIVHLGYGLMMWYVVEMGLKVSADVADEI